MGRDLEINRCRVLEEIWNTRVQCFHVTGWQSPLVVSAPDIHVSKPFAALTSSRRLSIKTLSAEQAPPSLPAPHNPKNDLFAKTMAAPRPSHTARTPAPSAFKNTLSHLFPRRRFQRRNLSPRLLSYLFVVLLIAAVILLPGTRFSSHPHPPKSNPSPAPLPPPPAPPVLPAVEVLLPHPVEQGPVPSEERRRVPVGGDTVAGLVGGESREGEKGPRVGVSLSAVVLFHDEYATLEHTLQTWDENDLPAFVSEILFFLNGVSDADPFLANLPILSSARWKGMIRVEVSAENLKLGLAIRRMVQLAKEDVVLLLEKDWALIEPPSVVGPSLRAAKRLVEDDVAQVVRFRHRNRPGAPLHARIMHEGREPQMLAQQSNLYCYLHHWVDDPVTKYPDYFSKCSDRAEDRETWCSKAKYCQWTNNPSLFRKRWFETELAEKYVAMYNATINTNPSSNMLDFEFFTNWRNDVWNGRDFVVALPKGLFEHQEVGEQNLMNTVWYAWNRLSTDVEEKMRALFNTESANCENETKSLASGTRYQDKYPIEFVHLYHYDRAMQRTVEEAVAELEQKSLSLRKQLEDGNGNWRHGITELTNHWYKVVLYAYPEEPKDMDIAFVTALFGTDDEGEGQPSMEQIEKLSANLNMLSYYKLVVYCTEDTKAKVEAELKNKHGWDASKVDTVEFAVHTLDVMLKGLLGTENVERIKQARKNDQWTSRVKERSNGEIPSINSLCLSMAKPYIIHDAMQRGISKDLARATRATHYVWFDPSSECLSDVGKLSDNNDHVLRGHMLLNTLVSGVRVNRVEKMEAMLAGSGFSREGLLREMEKSESDLQGSGLALIDLKTIGGSQLALTLMKGYYDVVLRDMLRKGEVGTGREAMSIAHENVKYNFKFFNGADTCRSGDKGCGAGDVVDRNYVLDNGKSGCKLYRWAGSCKVGGG